MRDWTVSLGTGGAAQTALQRMYGGRDGQRCNVSSSTAGPQTPEEVRATDVSAMARPLSGAQYTKQFPEVAPGCI